jgi:hypothetical protein
MPFSITIDAAKLGKRFEASKFYDRGFVIMFSSSITYMVSSKAFPFAVTVFTGAGNPSASQVTLTAEPFAK